MRVSRIRALARSAGALALSAALVAVLAGGAAGEEASPPVPDAQARAVVASLDAALAKSGGAADVARAAATDHRLVAERLAGLATDERRAADVRAASFEGLRLQRAAPGVVASRIGKWVERHSEADAEALRRGEIGVPVDRRTGDAIAQGTAFDAAVKASAERAAWVASGVRLLAAHPAPRDAGALLRPFLQSPHDDLAVAALGAIGAWKSRDALEDVRFLFRMYPRENRWETSAVAHIGGTNASAKAEWMRYFGHPLKQRARPEVHRAIRAAIEAVTGRKVTHPDELDAAPPADAGPPRRAPR